MTRRRIGFAHAVALAAYAFYLALLVFASIALRTTPGAWILAAPAVLVTVTSVITYGGGRLRHGLDPQGGG